MVASRFHSDGRTSMIGVRVIMPLYRVVRVRGVRSWLRRLVLKLEGGAVYSRTIREIFHCYHGVRVGLYTIGPCEGEPGNLAPGTVVGRYSSVYYTVRSLVRDCPVNGELAGGLFCESVLGGSGDRELVPGSLVIGNDVWIGHNAILLPTVEAIGDGAVVGAGSVVQNRVPPYAVVTGNPARVVRYRFSEQRIRELLESKWWQRSIEELSSEIEEFQKPLEGTGPIR